MTKPLSIENANLNDIDELVALEAVCFTTDQISAEEFQLLINKPTSLVTIGKIDARIIACSVTLLSKKSNIARLYTIGVHPNFHKQGIAMQLLLDLEQKSLAHGYPQMQLEVRKDNYQALNFYRKNGYEIFGEFSNFYEDGEDAIRMKKILHDVELK